MLRYFNKNLIFVWVWLVWSCANGQDEKISSWPACPDPDRILMTWTQDPSTSFTVTWRSTGEALKPAGEIALAVSNPSFDDHAEKVSAEVSGKVEDAVFYKVSFTNLKPGQKYVYRVGGDHHWSEWFLVKTPDLESDNLNFIYLGDGQNRLKSKWSRAIRAAYAHLPKADFMIHAGDLINHAEEDDEWGDFFYSGSFILSQIPFIATVGNHEYVKNKEGKKVRLSKHWNPQFNFPDNGPEGLEDQTYFIDVHNIRLIVLNTNERLTDQAEWLLNVLKQNTKKWTIVIHHHPIKSVATGRQNEGISEHWQPLFEQYKVDLVLQGHDHAYARGGGNKHLDNNLDHEPVYVVSVSGPKMYAISENLQWADKVLDNMQLFHLIRVSDEVLEFKTYSLEGEILDEFSLEKSSEKVILK